MEDWDDECDDEYEDNECETRPEQPPEHDYRALSCLNCRGQLAIIIPAWERHMTHGFGCACGEAFMIADAAGEHLWRGRWVAKLPHPTTPSLARTTSAMR